MRKAPVILFAVLVATAAFAEEIFWDRLQQAESTEAALELCDAELQRNPRDYYVYFSRAMIKRRSGNLSGALSDFNHAIELEPAFSGAYVGRAYTKKEQGDIEGFESDLAKSKTVDHILDNLSERISRDKKDAKAYLDRATHKKNAHPPDLYGAIEDFEAYLVLQDEKRNQMPYIYLANCYKRIGLTNKAIRTLSRGIENFPNYDGFYQRRMGFRKQVGDSQGAEEDMKKLASFAKEKPNKLIEKLSIDIKKASAQPGASALTAGLLAMRADAYLDVGDIESAQKDIGRALEIDPRNRMARNTQKKIEKQKASNKAL